MAQESKNENRKQRIREAFHDGKQVERMPAREDMAPQHSDDVIYRVAPYCRVSTMSEMQAESFEIQQMCLDTLGPNSVYGSRRLWLENGGSNTYRELLYVCSLAERSRIIHFLSTLPDHFDVEVGDRKFHLVHAMPSDDPDDRIWRRPKPDDPPYFEDRIAVVGHTPTCYMSGDMESPFAVWHGNGLIDIDCGCGNKTELRRLACLRLDDLKEFYI